MATSLPEDDAFRDRWDIEPESLVLQGRPRELSFTMIRAASLSGRVIDGPGVPVAGLKLLLMGEELPPGCNVLDEIMTDGEGCFDFEDVPVGRSWWFSLRGVRPSEHERTRAFVFQAPKSYRVELRCDSKAVLELLA